MHRTSLLLVLLTLGAAVAGACSNDDSILGDASLGDATSLGDVTSIELTPAMSELALTRGMTATAMLRVTARHRNGGVSDQTQAASWSSSGSSSGASIQRGRFTASLPGSFTVAVTLGAHTARAQITVRVTGDLTQPGVPGDAGDLLGRGVPGSAPRPEIAYPLEGAIFPSNFGDTEIHVTKTSRSQALARVAFSGSHIQLSMFAACSAIPGAPDGCAVTVDPALVPLLVAASEGAQMNLQVRLVSPDGTNLAESAAREVRWAPVPLRGALYYWSTRPGANPTAIYRYNLETPRATPEVYFLQSRDSPTIGTERPCVGCHAISRDGRRMALAFGGSDPANFGLYDIATRRPIATRLSDHAYNGPENFGTMSALSPDGSRIVTVLRGAMTLRSADASLAAIGGPLFATGLSAGDRVTQPYWSSDGSLLAFVGWNPSMYDCNNPPCGARQRDNGDLAPYGQIYTAPVTGDRIGAPRLIAARSTTNGGRDYTSHYPSISDDSQWVVFNRVRCDSPGNGQGYPVDRTGSAANCSGYDNPGARVMLVPISGGAPVDLARLNGDRTWTNSWPRWAPNHGRFRGAELYWVAYSSKRPYGLRFPGDPTGMRAAPQLWFSAITLGSGDVLTGDPSHAPVWMPRQNVDADTPSGNHVPQWVAVFVPTPG